MTEQEIQLYAEHEALPKDQRWEFMCTHDGEIDGEGLAKYREHRSNRKHPDRHKDLNRHHGKRFRGRLVAAQGGVCGLCEESFKHKTPCLDSDTGKVVCRRCTMYLAARRRIYADGITEEMVLTYEANIIDKEQNDESETK